MSAHARISVYGLGLTRACGLGHSLENEQNVDQEM